MCEGEADGKYKGRKPTARAKAAEVIRLDADGLQRTEIARRTGIGVASVYRVLAEAKKAGRSDCGGVTTSDNRSQQDATFLEPCGHHGDEDVFERAVIVPMSQSPVGGSSRSAILPPSLTVRPSWNHADVPPRQETASGSTSA